MLPIFYGLMSALSWGAGDFAGGLASRKLGAYRAVFFGDAIGLTLVVLVSLFFPEKRPTSTMFINAMLGGAFGTLGLLTLYMSMSRGRMSFAAPVSALFAAVLPVIVALFTQGLPTLNQFIGFGFALVAVWLTSQGHATERFRLEHLSDLRLPLLAGLGFGGYFIFLHRASSGSDSTLMPLILSRATGTVIMLGVMLLRRESFAIRRATWGVVSINAALDVGGNLFYILASQIGRLDVSAVLSSLYPGSTVLLAWILLKEHISVKQWVGILAALIAIVFFTM